MMCQKWPLNWLFLLSIYKHKGIKHAHKKREWLCLFFYMDKGPAAESRRRQRGEGWSQTADDVQAERASSPSCHMDRSQACYLSSTDSEMSPAWQLRRNRKGRAMSISVQGFSRITKREEMTLACFRYWLYFSMSILEVILLDLHSVIVYSTAFTWQLYS